MKKLKSIEHVWSVACSKSSIDDETNNLTLFNVLERLTFTAPASQIEEARKDGNGLVIFPVEFEVVSRFKKIDSSKTTAFDFNLKIVNGKEIYQPGGISRKIALTEGIKNMRVRNRLTSLPVTHSGEYQIIVEARDIDESEYVEVGRIPLDVVIVEESSKK